MTTDTLPTFDPEIKHTPMNTSLSHSRLRRTSAVLVLLPVLVLWGCSDTAPLATTETVRPAYVSTVSIGSTEGLGYVGEVRAARRAELAFAVAGRVASVGVDVGDPVRRGQVLATLDLQPLAAQLAAAQAGLAQAEAQLTEAQQRQARVALAQASGAVSSAEAGAAQVELVAAEAAQRAAASQRDVAEWSLAQATLRAPVDGTVASRVVEPGQASGPGAPVITIDGEGRELTMLLPATVPVKPGQTVALRSPGSETTSRVLRVAARLEAGGMRRVTLQVPEAAEVGSTWTASLPAAFATTSVLRVPLRAVLPDAAAGSGRVLRLAADGSTVEQVAVQLGALHGAQIEVTQGLASGDRVVVAGATGIRPGSLVRPVAYPDEAQTAEVKP